MVEGEKGEWWGGSGSAECLKPCACGGAGPSSVGIVGIVLSS